LLDPFWDQVSVSHFVALTVSIREIPFFMSPL
jgi:hypothetical protein